MLHPSLSRRFRTNDRQLRYRLLQHGVFGETFLSVTKSKCGNKYAKVFFTKFEWSCAFPMAKKGGAHEAIFLFFQRYGVPPKKIVDGIKDQTLSVYKRKVAEAGFHLR